MYITIKFIGRSTQRRIECKSSFLWKLYFLKKRNPYCCHWFQRGKKLWKYMDNIFWTIREKLNQKTQRLHTWTFLITQGTLSLGSCYITIFVKQNVYKIILCKKKLMTVFGGIFMISRSFSCCWTFIIRWMITKNNRRFYITTIWYWFMLF